MAKRPFKQTQSTFMFLFAKNESSTYTQKIFRDKMLTLSHLITCKVLECNLENFSKVLHVNLGKIKAHSGQTGM